MIASNMGLYNKSYEALNDLSAMEAQQGGRTYRSSDDQCPNCGYCRHCGRGDTKVEKPNPHLQFNEKDYKDLMNANIDHLKSMYAPAVTPKYVDDVMSAKFPNFNL